MDTFYYICATWTMNKQTVYGWVEINPDIKIGKKDSATLFKSKVLAYGWLIKSKILFRSYKFSVVPA